MSEQASTLSERVVRIEEKKNFFAQEASPDLLKALKDDATLIGLIPDYGKSPSESELEEDRNAIRQILADRGELKSYQH